MCLDLSKIEEKTEATLVYEYLIAKRKCVCENLVSIILSETFHEGKTQDIDS